MSRLIDHVRYVAGVVGTSRAGSATAVGPQLSSMVIREVNHAVRRIWGFRDWARFGTRDHTGRVWAQENTGTITLTQGSRIVTGAGTAFNKSHQHGLIEVGITGGLTLRQRIRTVDSPTQLQLMGPWGTAGQAGTSFVLYQDTYPLPFDAQNVEDRSVNLFDLAEPLWRIDRRDLDILHGSTTSFATGEPQRYIDDEVSDYDLWATADDSGAGTVAITANTTALVGTGTSWDDTILNVGTLGDVLLDWPVQLISANLSTINGIDAVASGTGITLRQKYRGATETAVDYIFGPAGTPLIMFWPPPTESTAWSCRYRLKHIDLVNDDDVCLIPPQWDHVVDELAASRALFQMKGGEAVQAQAHAHYARFQAAILDMAAWDHPQKKHASRMGDQGLLWEFLGGMSDVPEFAGPQYWRANG